MKNTFTDQERKDFESILGGPPILGPDVIIMNPRDYAALKVFFACSQHLYDTETRLGRRLGRIERRWMEDKFYKRKCKPQFVDPIPFPEEKP